MIMKAVGLIIAIPSVWYSAILLYVAFTSTITDKTIDVIISGILFLMSGSLGLLIFQMSKLTELMKGK